VDESILIGAQRLMSKYTLSPRDSMHIASAIDTKIQLIISGDEDFDRIREIKREPLI
jgi:predicted nucleic acid-binding protein